MEMLTFVTGATGLVGNNVVRLLLERGRQVRVLVRPTANPRALAGLGVEIVAGDVQQPDVVRAACHGAGQIVHAAALVQFGWTGIEKQRAVNVEGTRHVVEAAKAAGVRLVHVSTADTLGMGTRAAPGDEESPQYHAVPCPYVITKREAEQIVLDEVGRGLDAVIVNPTYMVGPWDWKPSSGQMILQVGRGYAKIAPSGGTDICDVRDVAAGILTALERGGRGRRYILGGEAVSLFDAWKMIAAITGVKPPWRVGRRPVLRFFGRCGDLWGRVTGREPVLNSAAVEIGLVDHHFSYARAQKELGYSPRPAREAIEAAWNWFVEHGYARRRASSLSLDGRGE
jgi:dihydroflavonol-4-reductase